MTVKDLHARFVADTQDHISEDALEDSASTLIPADTLIVATRMSLGKITRPLVPTAINQDLKALFLHDGIDKTYVEYLWRANEARIQDMGTGTTVKGIRLEDIRGLEVSLAPRNEQTRIANQLDTLLTRTQACNDRFDAIPALLKRFRQTVLETACSGGFAGGIAGSSSRESYLKVRLSEVAETRLGKMLDKQKNSGTPTPYIGNINVRWFSFNLEALQFISINDREKAGLEVRDGDVFICEGGEPGRCAIWNAGPTNIVFQKALHRVRPVKERLLSQWLAYCIRHMTDTEQLKPFYTGTTIRHLTGASLSQVLLPLPSVEEQTEIVRRVEALFALADRIEARCTAARTQAQRLTPLVLAKAFRGELVPQDPTDEPASALLARLLAQHGDAATPTKIRQLRKPRAVFANLERTKMIKSRQDDDVTGKPYLSEHLRRIGAPVTAEALFKLAELPIADFYKQLVWEVDQGFVMDNKNMLEPLNAA